MKARAIVKRSIKLTLSDEEADIFRALLSGVEDRVVVDPCCLGVQVKHMLEELDSVICSDVTFSDLFEGEVVVK